MLATTMMKGAWSELNCKAGSTFLRTATEARAAMHERVVALEQASVKEAKYRVAWQDLQDSEEILHRSVARMLRHKMLCSAFHGLQGAGNS